MEQKITENTDSGKRFRIKWVNTDRSGMGYSRNTYTRKEADELSAELNARYPKIKHTVQPL